MKSRIAHAHNPDHTAQVSRCRRIKGQVEGVERMIKGKKYCPDILTQIRAARAALKSLEAQILEKHFQHCVSAAFESRERGPRLEKINELINLFRRA